MADLKRSDRAYYSLSLLPPPSPRHSPVEIKQRIWLTSDGTEDIKESLIFLIKKENPPSVRFIISNKTTCSRIVNEVCILVENESE